MIESSGLTVRGRSDRRCLPGTTPRRQTYLGAQRPLGARVLPHLKSVVAARLLALFAKSRAATLNPPPAGAGGEMSTSVVTGAALAQGGRCRHHMNQAAAPGALDLQAP
ncbi:hypothetical protein CKO23_16640 [Thiocystis violacea]|nr:hypothetical protein [Thiocystis violacea]